VGVELLENHEDPLSKLEISADAVVLQRKNLLLPFD